MAFATLTSRGQTILSGKIVINALPIAAQVYTSAIAMAALAQDAVGFEGGGFESLNDGEIPWKLMVMVILAIFGGLLTILLVVVMLTYGKLWIQAWTSGADVKMFDLVGMGFRKVRPNVIVNAKIMAKQAQLDISRRGGITTQRLEAHYLAGGDVMRVIRAIIAAQRAQIDLDFDRAAAIDLAGRDVMDAALS